MRVVHARLSPADLEKWRNATAVVDALEHNPQVFMKEEAIGAFFRYYELAGELHEEYESPVEENPSISSLTGHIYYDD